MINLQSYDRNEPRYRAGTTGLTALASPINVAILADLTEGPRSLSELRRAAGAPSQSTLRLRLREMAELGMVDCGRQAGFPRALGYELTPSGRGLREAMEVLRVWLEESPSGPIALGSQAAKGSIKALVDGWSSTIVRALAAKALTLTELDRLIAGLNYPSLERRLGAMRSAGHIAPLQSRGPGTPYAVTKWLRRGVAPLIASIRWERLHAAETTAPIGRLDVEAAFLLAVPLVAADPELSGSCRMTVETRREDAQGLAGILVDVEEGRVVSGVTNLKGDADASASGSAIAWLQSVIEHDRDELETSGDRQLADGLVDALHSALFVLAGREVVNAGG